MVSYGAQWKYNLRKQREKDGLCWVCGKETDRFKNGKPLMCSYCLFFENLRKSKWARERIRNNICPRCGGILNNPGRTCCKKCMKNKKKQLSEVI